VIARLTQKDPQALEVLRRARKLNPQVKIMVIKGNHDQTFPLEAFELEVDDYLLMPVSPVELRRRVNACLGQVKARAPKASQAARITEINERVLNRLMLMFHDIRGAMVSTAAGLKLVNRGSYGEVAEGVAAKLQEAYDRVKKAIGLTEEFMHAVLSGVGNPDLAREPLDLKRDIVESVLEELAGELGDFRINIDNRLNRHLTGAVSLNGNRVWVKSVFRNLLHNAIRHGGQGCTIVIDLEEREADCRLRVYNSGRPIPEEYRPLLFSKAKRLASPRPGASPGLGLGLYLSRDVIRRQGGDLWYEARKDGSDFVVSLPRT
jgi:signal transduction histidine kinase